MENVESGEEQSVGEDLLAMRRFKVLDGEWTSEELGRFFWLTPKDMLQVKTCPRLCPESAPPAVVALSIS